MWASHSADLRRKWVAGNLAEYGDAAATLRWVDSAQARAFEERRANLLAALAPALRFSAKHTKPHLGELAPGCRICGQGAWSCLFINGQCNCRCFYCPTEQNEIGVPTTNRIPFGAAEAYADYVERFGFAGVSISGGEPLLTFQRTIEYLAAVRDRFGDDLHTWLYTNGTLATPERLRALRNSGLKEIRFDITAVDYDLTRARLASEAIECVTVEIPAIPEDVERLSALLPELSRAGVRHLNLHQLRLTPHNVVHLKKRNYTYLHGESVTVLESELAALALLQRARESNLPLAVNYCSFVYKRRFQQAAARRRSARAVLKDFEAVTENGFIRTLSLAGTPAALDAQAERLGRQGADQRLWSLSAARERLVFHPSLWPQIDAGAARMLVTYSEAVLAPCISYRHFFKELRLSGGTKIYVEKRPLQIDLEVTGAARRLFEKMFLDKGSGNDLSAPGGVGEYEFIRPGLQEYF